MIAPHERQMEVMAGAGHESFPSNPFKQSKGAFLWNRSN
jgi:hypothetical protein